MTLEQNSGITLPRTTLPQALDPMGTQRRDYAEAVHAKLEGEMSNDDVNLRDVMMRMTDGFQVSAAIHVVATLGIADLLANGPRTIDDLAHASDCHVSALDRILRALASVGVFTNTEGCFALTPLAQYLRSDHPQSTRAWAMQVGQDYFWTSWGHLLHCVRTGEPAFPALYEMSAWEFREAHPEENAIFNAAMTAITADNMDAVVTAYDFSGIRVLADIGGGEGRLLAEIVRANPEMRGILFDQAHVVSNAHDIFRQAGVSERMDVCTGNFFESVPTGADAYIMKMIVHDWDDAAAVVILQKCRAAIPPDGRLLIVDRVLKSGNVPDPARFMDINMLVMLGGRERTADDFERILADAGFQLARVIPTKSALSIVEAVPV